MFSMLAAAVRAKNNPSKRDTGFVLRSQYPQYVLYDSDGDEVECNMSAMKMSYGSGSKTALTDIIISPRRNLWSHRKPMEKYLILLVSALFVVTIGFILTAGIVSYNKQLAIFLRSENSTENTATTKTLIQAIINASNSPTFSSSTTDAVNTRSTESMAIPNESDIKANSSQTETIETNSVIKDNTLESAGSEAVVQSPDICRTSACERAGKLIEASLNKSVDPCDDFYGFACGGWEATHTIPADKSRYGSFDAVDEQLKKDIKLYLSQSRTHSDSNAVIYASDLYKACIDEETINSRGISPLLTALDSIGGWPLSGHFSSDVDIDYDWRDSLAKVVAKMGLPSIFSVSIQPDANDTLVNRVYFDAASFGLGRNQLVNTSAYPDIVNAYKQYITQSAILLGAKNESQIQEDVNNLVDFETKLANLSLTPEKKRDSSVWYNRMTFEDFNKLTDNRVDWLNITNNIYSQLDLSIRVKSDELVIIQDMEYYKGVTELLSVTPSRVVANYLGWMAVMSLGSYTTKQFRDTVFDFDKVVSGVEKEAELWQTCTNSLSVTLQYAVSRLYVDNNFSQKDKQEAALMISDIKESYNELIAESDWLDESTKNKSLNKLNAIKQNIGFPDWLLNNEELDKYYSLKQKVDPKKSFEGLLYIQNILVLREFKSIREAVNLTLSWPMPPAIVNAAYEPTQNSITIPAGILKLPFFDSQRPAYLNYGAIGLVVGHEMTHGFDDEGSQFDLKGDLINWWSEDIRKRFEQKADCFINEYSSIYVPEVNMNLNGKNTVGENIADNGGMRESYRAFQLYVKRHGEPQRLPYVSEYTAKQLYFIGHANVWCSLWRPEALKNQIQYNPHSPGKYRVNVPASNFIEFSNAYGCTADSPMNRKDKCVLW